MGINGAPKFNNSPERSEESGLVQDTKFVANVLIERNKAIVQPVHEAANDNETPEVGEPAPDLHETLMNLGVNPVDEE